MAGGDSGDEPSNGGWPPGGWPPGPHPHSPLSATDPPPAAKRPARPEANDPEWRRLGALATAPPHNIASALDDRLQSPILFSPTPVVSPPSSSSHGSPRIPRPRLGKPSEIPGRAQSPSDAPPAPLAGFPPPKFPCRSGCTRRLLFSRVRKNQPKEAMSFRFLKRRIPTIHPHILGRKTPLPGFPQHLLKVLVLGLPALGLVIHHLRE